MRRVVEVYIGSANHAWLMGLGGVCGVESMVLLLGSRLFVDLRRLLESLAHCVLDFVHCDEGFPLCFVMFL